MWSPFLRIISHMIHSYSTRRLHPTGSDRYHSEHYPVGHRVCGQRSYPFFVGHHLSGLNDSVSFICIRYRSNIVLPLHYRLFLRYLIDYDIHVTVFFLLVCQWVTFSFNTHNHDTIMRSYYYYARGEGMEAGGSSSCCCEIYLAVAVLLGLSVLYYTKLVDVSPIHFYVEMPIIF